MQKKERTSFTTGFRLVDLAIVVICAGILLGLWLPGVGGHRPGKRSRCINNMRQVILACHNYQSAHLRFPCASGVAYDNTGTSLIADILPYLDEGNVYNDYQAGMGSTPMPKLLAELSSNKIPLLECPGGGSQVAPELNGLEQFMSHYYASLGPNSDPDGVGYQFSYSANRSNNQSIGLSGVFSPWSSDPTNPDVAAVFDHQYGKKFDDMRDGSSNTVAFLESSRTEDTKSENALRQLGWAFGHSASKTDLRIEYVFSGCSVAHRVNYGNTDFGWNDQPISSNHAGGAHIAMADGSARFVDEEISIEILRAASSIDDGQVDELE